MDIKKAFDMVDRGKIKEVLERIRMGEELLKVIGRLNEEWCDLTWE